MRYSKEFKLECIRKYKNGEHIEDPPGVKHRFFHGQLLKWARMYDSLGEAGLEYGRPTLNIDQRLELIQKVEAGESYSSVAFSAGIGSDLLIRWHKTYMESGIDGLKSLKRGKKPSMNKKKPDSVDKQDFDKSKQELLEELEYLKAENEYLKKLSALVQKRKAQPLKKK